MTPETFIKQYEAALAAQDWQQVEPLVHPEACVTFSSGAVHVGKTAVRHAFEHNFRLIQDETYQIENVHWVMVGAETNGRLPLHLSLVRPDQRQTRQRRGHRQHRSGQRRKRLAAAGGAFRTQSP